MIFLTVLVPQFSTLRAYCHFLGFYPDEKYIQDHPECLTQFAKKPGTSAQDTQPGNSAQDTQPGTSADQASTLAS